MSDKKDSQQKIEAPTTTDIDFIARRLVHAMDLVSQLTGKSLSWGTADLLAIQKALDSNAIEPEATYSLQALGLALGKVFVENNENYDWWMVEDEYGRDPAIRYKKTTLLIFPQTMISKRIEDGELVDVQEIYEGLLETVLELIAKNYAEN